VDKRGQKYSDSLLSSAALSTSIRAYIHMKEQLSVKEVCSNGMIQIWTLADDFIYTSQAERSG